jgi:hypothetical protein
LNFFNEDMSKFKRYQDFKTNPGTSRLFRREVRDLRTRRGSLGSRKTGTESEKGIFNYGRNVIKLLRP